MLPNSTPTKHQSRLLGCKATANPRHRSISALEIMNRTRMSDFENRKPNMEHEDEKADCE
jgi:hypothetical protein